MAYLGNTPTSQSFTSNIDYFSGTGSATAFTLSRSVATINDILVVVDNVVQRPTDAYTLSGSVITFTSAPLSGTNNIYVRYMATTTQVVAPAANSVSYATLNTDLQGLTCGMKNRLINGAMQVWQRGTSFSNSNGYTADRWFLNRNGGISGVSASRSGTNPSNYYYKIQRTAGDTSTNNFDFRQVIETLNCYDLAGQTVTMSFTAYAGANWSGGSFYAAYQYSTVVDDGVNVVGSWTGVTGPTITPTTTPTRYTYTFNVPLGTLTLMARLYGFPYSGTAGADDSIYISNIQLEKGATATNFDYRPYGTELQLCQRYYQLATATMGVGQSTTTTDFSIQLQPQMRTAPTCSQAGVVTISDTVSADFIQSAVGFSSIDGPSQYGHHIRLNNFTGLTTYRPYIWRNTNSTNNILLYSAEL